MEICAEGDWWFSRGNYLEGDNITTKPEAAIIKEGKLFWQRS